MEKEAIIIKFINFPNSKTIYPRIQDFIKNKEAFFENHFNNYGYSADKLAFQLSLQKFYQNEYSDLYNQVKDRFNYLLIENSKQGFNYDELMLLISIEAEKQSYEKLKRQIELSKPQDLSDYIDIFIKIQKEKYQKRIPQFIDLLKNESITYPEIGIIQLINSKFNSFKENEQKNISLKLTNSKENSLIKAFISKHYQNIENYLYESNDSFQEVSDEISNELEILVQIINNRGYPIETPTLKNLIKNEYIEEKYLRLKNKLNYVKHNNIDNIAEAFIEIMGENFSENILLIERYLDEKKIAYSSNQLVILFNKIKKEKNLKKYEQTLISSNNLAPTISDIDSFNGHQFEEFLQNIFTKRGFKVTRHKLTNDQGADLTIEKFGEKTVIQAKRYKGSVGNEAIQQVVASIKQYRAHKGMVVTTSYYTRQAIELAKSNNIELIDRDKLQEIIYDNYN